MCNRSSSRKLLFLLVSALLLCAQLFAGIPAVQAVPAAITSIPVGSSPHDVGINPDTNRIYVANINSGNLSVIDGHTNSVVANIGLGTFPYGVGVNPATNRIYVSNEYDGTVSMIDGSTNTVTSTITVGSWPRDVGVNPATNRAYVANYAGDTVSVIDCSSNTVMATVPVGSSPWNVCVNPDTNLIYATNEDSGSVSVIDGSTNTVTATVAVGGYPVGVDINPATRRLYVANFFGNTVSVIDTVSNTVTGTISLGGGTIYPSGVCVDTGTNRIYTSNYNNATVSSIDGSTNMVSSTVGMGYYSRYLAINPVTGLIYVSNEGSDNVTVFHGEPVISATAGTGGSITPSGMVAATYDTDQAFTITPSTGYHVSEVLVDGVFQGPLTSYTFPYVTENHSISAQFAVNTYTVSASVSGGHGSVQGTQSVDYNESASVAITPDAGYHIASITDNGSDRAVANPYVINNVTAAHNVVVTFALDTFTISASAGTGGSISPIGATVVNYGASQSYAITPDAGWHVADVLVDGSSVGAISTYEFTGVAASHTIGASFAPDSYTITASAGSGGSISPAGPVPVDHGEDKTFGINPDAHYHVAGVLVDGVSVGAVSSYTFTGVTADHTIEASFAVDTCAIYTVTSGSGEAAGGGTYAYGGNVTLTATPDTGWHFVNWTENGTGVSTDASYSFTASSSRILVANFAVDTHTVTATVDGGGTAYGAGTYDYGATATLTATPAGNRHFVDWTEGGVEVSTGAVYSFTVTGDRDLTAHFAVDTFSVNASAFGGHGTVSPATQNVAFGGTASIDLLPDPGYHASLVIDNGEMVPMADPYVLQNVSEEHDILVFFDTDVDTWYLAEGCTMDGMETWVMVENVDDHPVTLSLVFTTPQGLVVPVAIEGTVLAPETRVTFDVGTYVESWDVSTMVRASGGNVTCERAMYGNGRTWATDSIGTRTPAETWYLAEGSTGEGFETWVLVQNPGGEAVTVDLTLMTGTGEQKPGGLQGLSIPATSRRSFRLNDFVTDYDVSTVVSASGPVVAERSMYGGDRTWGTCSVGTAAPAATWYLAEGSTGEGFETWVLVQNPGGEAVTVDLTLMTGTGEQKPPALQGVAIPAGTRRSFNLVEHVTDYDVSTVVSASGPVVAERSMYGGDRTWGTCSVGTAAPAATWYLAEGSTGEGFETWVLVQNPGDAEVAVDLTFFTPSGPVEGPSGVAIPAGTRRSFNLGDYVTDYDVSTVVSASGPVVVERSMYDASRAWGTCSVGYAP